MAQRTNPSRSITSRSGKARGAQRFPTDGILSTPEHLNVTRSGLQVSDKALDTEVYSYVMASIKMEPSGAMSTGQQPGHPSPGFQQIGCGPNIQGGIITLCACKHGMRATRDVEEWEGKWIAGLTSRTLQEGRHWLFYLMRVQKAFQSQGELWNYLKPSARQEKAAHLDPRGDVFKPKPGCQDLSLHTSYHPPCSGHVHFTERAPDKWHKDVERYTRRRYREPRHAALLVGQPVHSFLWTRPLVATKNHQPRAHQRWESLSLFLQQLCEPA